MLAGCEFRSGRSEQEALLARLPRQTESSSAFEAAMTNSPAAAAQTDLSPIVLFHSRSKTIRLFVPGSGSVFSPPRYLAYGANGPKILTNAITRSITNMQERWLLAWFHGATGWEKSDCPIGIQLEHPPRSITLDAQGVRLEFGETAGYWGMMALYGVQPLPTSVAEAVGQGIPRDEFKKLPRVWEWASAVPRDPLTRLRYWGSAFSRFPYQAWRYVEPVEGGAHDAASIHFQFDWMSAPCDWEVTPWSQAPLSTPLARASRQFPHSIRLSPVAYDMQVATPSGPLFAVGNSLTYSAHVTGLSLLPTGARQTLTGAESSVAAAQPSWRPCRFVDLEGAAPISSLRVAEAAMRLEWLSMRGDRVEWISLGEMDAGQDHGGSVETRSVNANTRLQIWR
ncbi:MAG: hypothetical protein HYR88_15685 [Verrucomicrobia bacterium]|nr:hypothetical protein [Verrucomicrobiota bacterium]MBI3867740.1 hypothetical protein [Verrucomicrobiota bacterium]